MTSGATFWLRADARWSDGQPVTAHDFVFAWRTDRRPGQRLRIRVHPVPGEERRSDQSRQAADRIARRHAQSTTAHSRSSSNDPRAYFDKLVAYATYGPVREDFYEAQNGRYGADADTLLYNGPFRITRWVHGAHLRFEKNPYYWDRDRIRLNVIDMPYVTDDAERGAQPVQGRQDRQRAPLSAETLDDALEQRWKINRFNDGACLLQRIQSSPRPRHGGI